MGSDASDWKGNLDKFVRPVLLTLSAVGLLVFGAAFLVSFADRSVLEETAKNFAKAKVAEEARERFPLLENEAFTTQAEALRDRFAGQSEKLQLSLDAKFDEIIAKALAPDNTPEAEEKRGTVRDFAKGLLQSSIDNKTEYQQRLTAFAQNKYNETIDGLIRDVRIFTGTTAAAFLFIFMALIFKYRARRHVVLPALLLFASAGYSVYAYIFTQNWFYIILSNNFMGWAYLVWMTVIFGLLADICFNKARIIRTISELFSNITSVSIS